MAEVPSRFDTIEYTNDDPQAMVPREARDSTTSDDDKRKFVSASDLKHTYRETLSTVDPGADETTLANDLTGLFQHARSERAPMYSLWNKCYRALRNQSGNAGSGGYSTNLRVPEIWPIVRQSVGYVMDQEFETDIVPSSAVGTEWHQFQTQRGRDLSIVMEAGSHVNQEDLEIQRGLWDADTYGTAIFKSTWDNTLLPSASGPMGDALTRRISPFNIYPDPAASSLDECDYICEARPMSLLQLDRKIPGAMKMFVDGGYGLSIDEAPSQLGGSNSRQSRLLPAALVGSVPLWTNPGSGSSADIRPTDTVNVIECWLREHDVEMDAKTGEISVVDGWRVVIVAGPYVLFNERADELWGHGWHPYSRYVPHDLGEFWGIGLCQLLGPVQAGINRLLGAVQRNIELTGDPQLVEDTRSTTQRSSIAHNEPGTRMTKRPGSEYRWMEPPKFSQEPQTLISYLLQRMEVISGITPPIKGGEIGGRPSSDTVDSMQEAAHVATRERLRNLESCLSDAWTKKASLIAENYTAPRFVSIAGPESKETPMMLAGHHFMRPAAGGTRVPLEYQCRVDVGSTHQTSRRMRENDVVTRYTLGLYDVVTALERLKDPNPQQVAERLGMQQMLMGGGPNKRERARA